MATTLTVEESQWRITLSGELGSGPLPLSYIEKLVKYDTAIQALASAGLPNLQTAEAAPEPEEEFVYWPSTGTVTSKEIAAAWVIGESTWKQKVYDGPYPKPLEVESMKKLWDVQAVTKALTYSGVQRRRVIEICEKKRQSSKKEDADSDEK